MRIQKVTRTRLLVAILLWLIGFMCVVTPSEDIKIDEVSTIHYIHVAQEEKTKMAQPINRGNTSIRVEKIEVEKNLWQDLSEEDIKLLYKIVWAESGNTSTYCKIATANVILNRIGSKYFPDTMRGVVYQGNGAQFNAIRRAEFGYYDEATKDAVNQALKYPIFENDVVFFANPEISTDKKFINNTLLPNQVLTCDSIVFARDPRGY